MDRQIENVLRSVEENQVKFIRLWFTDVLGQLKSVAIYPSELEKVLYDGISIDGSALEGVVRVAEQDMIALPDPFTFQLLPWRGQTNGTARMFCSIQSPGGGESPADTRNILKRQLIRASKLGLTFYAHPEIEFYLFDQLKSAATGLLRDAKDIRESDLHPIDDGGYFDHVPRSSAQDFRRATVELLEGMGISVDFSHHEAGPGQNEIDLRFADALVASDNIMTFRTVVKEVSLEREVFASFMPKPLSDQPGSGMHTHFSLFEDDKNAFYEPGAEYDLSPMARHFVAGVLAHAKEISAITNQYVNSYKRLWGGNEAPSYICWGHHNPSSMIRIPKHRPGKSSSTRVEVRTIDSAANPYLAYAAILAAGLDGVEKKTELPAPTNDNIWEMSDLERQALGIESLPHTLEDALKEMEKSELVADLLGEQVFDYFLRNKRREWTNYSNSISSFELENLLKKI